MQRFNKLLNKYYYNGTDASVNYIGEQIQSQSIESNILRVHHVASWVTLPP